MDRLLSEQEMAEIDNRHTSPSPYGGVILNMINARKECLASQLAKTDKEWVEWLETFIYNGASWIKKDDGTYSVYVVKEIGL
jgi:hypothetical protein